MEQDRGIQYFSWEIIAMSNCSPNDKFSSGVQLGSHQEYLIPMTSCLFPSCKRGLSIFLVVTLYVLVCVDRISPKSKWTNSVLSAFSHMAGVPVLLGCQLPYCFWYSLQKFIRLLLIPTSRTLTKILNSVVASIDPWGTPLVTSH